MPGRVRGGSSGMGSTGSAAGSSTACAAPAGLQTDVADAEATPQPWRPRFRIVWGNSGEAYAETTTCPILEVVRDKVLIEV